MKPDAFRESYVGEIIVDQKKGKSSKLISPIGMDGDVNRGTPQDWYPNWRLYVA
jgi:hypothetical protein